MATADRASRPTLSDLHDRLMPRTVLGLSALILAFAIGAAFSGVVFYSYYEFRKDKSDQFVKDFDNQFKTAIDNIHSERDNARAEIRKELEPLRQIAASGDTVSEVAKKVEPSVWFVRTLDEAGQPSVGSAFVVASDSSQTFMLTSYTTVRAATKRPGPQVVVRKGNQELKADLYTWEEGRDLALLIIGKGDIPKLSFAPREPALKVGERVFAVSGLGSAGTSVSQGSIADVSANGIQHDAAVGQGFQGGPLVNSKGELVGVASRNFAPLGFTSDGVYFAPPIRAACDKVLRCPDDSVAGAGTKR
ncbi:MAG: serine protease Do [Actinomycetota bacterium]|jgi:S1-C subfamily serine protease